MSTPTPRTDAAYAKWQEGWCRTPFGPDFARELERELADIRALADRRNKRDHAADTTHQLVAALDQALDIAQAELARERARLDWLTRYWDSQCTGLQPLGDTGYWPNPTGSARAAIDAAMKEETK